MVSARVARDRGVGAPAENVHSRCLIWSRCPAPSSDRIQRAQLLYGTPGDQVDRWFVVEAAVAHQRPCPL